MNSWALYSSILQMSLSSDWRAGYCRLLEGEGREEVEEPREWSWEAVGEQGSSRGSPCTQLSHGGAAVLFHPTYRQGDVVYYVTDPVYCVALANLKQLCHKVLS